MIQVLIADDHAIVRDGLRAQLSAEGTIEVVGEAATGRDALRLVTELRPDVVVLDVSMPDLNGIEAAGMMSQQFPGVRIVMLSMHSSSEHVLRAFGAGVAGYVLKESDSAEVARAVQKVATGGRYLSRAIEHLEAELSNPRRGTSPLERLSQRERLVLQLVVEGHSSSAIAAQIHLSPKTVESYRSRLMTKLGVKGVTALVKFAIEHGITPPGSA